MKYDQYSIFHISVSIIKDKYQNFYRYSNTDLRFPYQQTQFFEVRSLGTFFLQVHEELNPYNTFI